MHVIVHTSFQLLLALWQPFERANHLVATLWAIILATVITWKGLDSKSTTNQSCQINMVEHSESNEEQLV